MPTTTKTRARKVVMRSIRSINPSFENDKLYRPVRNDDPAFIDLVASVRTEGILSPIALSRDDYIISGHRRFAAAKASGLREVPVLIEQSMAYADGTNEEWTARLAIYNKQRVKTLDEQLREAVVLTNKDVAYDALLAHREQKADLSDCVMNPINLGDYRGRKAITAAKWPMLNAVLKVLEERRKFWPLSDRQIHYALLNAPPLKHAKKPASVYCNDRKSYQDLSNLLTRARLEYKVQWAAIADPTRPFDNWLTHDDAGDFLRDQVDDFATNFRRNLMQSQPNHIEVFAEKLTVRSIVRPIAMNYRIPLLIGRGFSSLPPRYEMAQRFRKSGKEKLVVLILSDHDPDGEQIAQSFARSMRDDFNIDGVHAIKVAINGEHVNQYHLPPNMEAKKTSVNHGKFVKAHGRHAYELEALPPATLQSVLTDAIESVVDRGLLNQEIEREKNDWQRVTAFRSVLLNGLNAVDFDNNG